MGTGDKGAPAARNAANSIVLSLAGTAIAATAAAEESVSATITDTDDGNFKIVNVKHVLKVTF